MSAVSATSKVLGGAGFLIGNVISPIMTYDEIKKRGHSTPVALAGAAASELFYSTKVGMIVGTTQLGIAAAQTAFAIGRDNGNHSSKFYNSQFGGNYNLSQNGYTLRQRGLQSIQKGVGGVQNALAHEARTYHRQYIT